MSIELTKGQYKAIKKGKTWYNNRTKQCFEISGKAGTGKTTVVFTLMQELGISIENVLFVTYIGKATLPLRMNGLHAKTIHSACYDVQRRKLLDADGMPIILPNGNIKYKMQFVKRESLSPKIKLIVVDEAGMVPKSMAKDLKSFGLPIITLGDKRQLDPVFGKPYFLRNPDVDLTEIMRQAKGDPIIYLADLAERGVNIECGKYGSRCFVTDESLLKYQQIYTKSDIILCSKNKTREKINNIIRYDINRYDSYLPVLGEKMVCRKNNWDENIGEISLINGLFGYVVNTYYETYNGDTMKIDFMPECIRDWFEYVPIDLEYLKATHEEKKQINTMFPKGNLFEYGYSCTVHLSQGSQYGYVLLIDEPMGDNEFMKKVRYTGITRAKNTLVMVKKQKKIKQSFFHY